MITIKEHPHKVQCDLCNSRDTLSIVRTGTAPYHYPAICRTDLKDIVIAGMEFFGIEPEPSDDLVKQLEAKDITIEQLQQNITELNSKTIELDTKLKAASKPKTAARKPASRKSATRKSTKGGAKK